MSRGNIYAYASEAPSRAHGCHPAVGTQRRVESTHLAGEEEDGGDAQPAVQGVEVGDICMVVIFKDGHQPQHGQDEGHQLQGCVGNFPGQLGPHPRLGQAIHQRRCRREQSQGSASSPHAHHTLRELP